MKFWPFGATPYVKLPTVKDDGSADIEPVEGQPGLFRRKNGEVFRIARWITTEHVFKVGEITKLGHEHVIAGWHFTCRPTAEMLDLQDAMAQLTVDGTVVAEATLLSLIRPADHKLSLFFRVEKLEAFVEKIIAEKAGPEEAKQLAAELRSKRVANFVVKADALVSVALRGVSDEVREALDLRCVLKGLCKFG